MTTLTIIHWKCHPEMTHSAEFFLKDILHQKMFRGLLFNIKNIRVTAAAIQPTNMNIMGEVSRRDKRPLRFKLQPFPELQWFFFRLKNTVKRFYPSSLDGDFVHRLAGVHDEVVEHLPDLGGIGIDRGNLGEIEIDDRLLADRGHQQLAQLAHDVVELHGFDDAVATSGVPIS